MSDGKVFQSVGAATEKDLLHIISKNYSVSKNVLKPVSVDSRDRD